VVDYSRLATTAARLIQSNGRSITFVKLSEAVDDPAKPWNGPGAGAETTLALNGVFVPPNTVRQFGLSALGEGTEFRDLVTFSEQIIITAQGENDLREYSSVVDRDDRWGIIGLQVLRPGDTSLIAFVGVRR
jgi:hypothetical protein